MSAERQGSSRVATEADRANVKAPPSAPPVFAFSSVPPPSPMRTLWWGAAGLALVGVASVPWASDQTKAAPPAITVKQPAAQAAQPAAQQPLAPAPHEPYRVNVRVEPATAEVRLDGYVIGKGQLRGTFAADGATHVFEASAPGYRTSSVSFRDAPPPETLILERLEGEAAR